MKKTTKVVAGLAWRYSHKDGVQVLLGKQKTGKLRGDLWEMPGGKIDSGETASMAIRREFREELAVDVVAGDGPISTAVLPLDDTLIVELVVVGEAREGEFSRAQALDHSELQWTSLHHAMRYLPCSPAFYVHYCDAVDYLRENAEKQW